MRNSDGTFMRGICPNPDGRPKGSKNFRARFFEYLAEKNQDKVEGGVNWLFELVGEGNLSALKLMLEYFGCKARNDDSEAEEQKPNFDASSAKNELIDEFMLVMQGKAKVVKVDEESKENDLSTDSGDKSDGS